MVDEMATDVTPTSATSPKLVKKNSLADIRYPFPSVSKTYGCGSSLHSRPHADDCSQTNTIVDHIKARIEDNQEEAIKKYASIIQAIQKPGSVVPHIPKTTSSALLSLQPTYLCFHCTHIATEEERASHEKEHNICEILPYS